MKILSEFENRMQDQPATAESIIKPAAYPRYSHDIPGGILRLNLEYKEYREYQIDRQLKEKKKEKIINITGCLIFPIFPISPIYGGGDMSRGGVRDVLVHAISVVEYNLVYHVHIQKSHVASGCTPPAWLPGFQLDVEVKAGRNLAELA